MANPDVTRANAHIARGIRSDVFPNPIYEEGCNPSKTDADKTVEDNAGDIEPHPVTPGSQNPANMPNVPQRATCKSTGICIAVMIIAAMLAMAMLIVGTWLYVQKPTQPVVGTTHTPGHPAVGTTHTPGHPAVGTTYTPGQPVVDTTYTPGQPDVDTTYTPGHTDVTASPHMSSHPTTGPKREVSTNGVIAAASTIEKALQRYRLGLHEQPPRRSSAELRAARATSMKSSAELLHRDCSCSPFLNAVCPVGWLRNQRSCYLLVNTPKTWQDARDACHQLQADLACLTTAEEQTYMAIQIGADNSYWFGLSDIVAEGNWHWVDGKDYDPAVTKWDTNEPNDMLGEDCAEIMSHGQWNDQACTKRRGYICERQTEYRGYTKVNFKVFAQLKTYEAAKLTCVSHGGHLADAKTQELHDLLLSEIQKVDGSSNYWIGLNDRTVENSWTWSDGTPVSDGVFTNWAPGEPNNYNNEQDSGKPKEEPMTDP
ncbi:hypothetical protein Bbelb_154990 [Branchiostoma belcheri]|nr:hypothetical protein Bbelb_154990 [Branchiostoma belcheri]